jgi:serine/threonine protein kinase
VQETTLSELYRVENFNDSFALGHYARVMDAVHRRSGRLVAFKVLRPEHMNFDGEPGWEYRAFANEVDLLMKMAGSEHVVRLLDCGYVASRDERPIDGASISYQADMLGFIRDVNVNAQRRWRPYLVLEHLPRTQNLLYLMKTNTAGVRWRLPTEEALDLVLQFAGVLKMAHQQRIVYLDHKLEHVYWDGKRLQVIDWNSSRIIEGTTNQTAQMFQTDIHHLAVGVMYPILTGLSPQQGSLSPQPASPVTLNQRYADVSFLDFGVEPTLSVPLQDIMQKGATRGFSSIEEFQGDLETVARRFGWSFPHRPAEDPLVKARAQTRHGLVKLRTGQDSLREARDLLREAAITDNINDDTEQELRRLLSAINEMLARRVIP